MDRVVVADKSEQETFSHLICGRELDALVDKLRSKLEADKARLLAKGRKLNVRMSEYISAQRGEDVKDAIRWLLGERNWRYVSFAEFIETLRFAVDRLHTEVYGESVKGVKGVKGDQQHVCFVVDTFNKSSFWVIVMAMLMRNFPNASLAIDDYGVVRRRSINMTFGDDDADEDSLFLAFRNLPDDTKLVLMDDAAYSGEQLSFFHDVVVSQWGASRRKKTNDVVKKEKKVASIFVVLPFISRPATALFIRRGTHLIFGETFPSLFDKRTPSQVIAGDLFIELEKKTRGRKSPLDQYASDASDSSAKSSYASLFFDVIGVLPTNSMFVFEHKIGDSLSIPNRWLKVGQCVPPNVTVAYRVKNEKAAKLVSFIRRDLETKGYFNPKKSKDDGPWSPAYRLMLLASSTIRDMLSTSSAFKEEFFDRIEIPEKTDDGGKPVAFLPLISPEFCDAPYRRYVRSHRVEKGKLGLALPNSGDDIPPCRRPPYKRTSYRRMIVV